MTLTNQWKQYDVTVHSKKDERYYQYRCVVAESPNDAARVVMEKTKDDDTIEICIVTPVVEQKL